jgi:hypothetical protein
MESVDVSMEAYFPPFYGGPVASLDVSSAHSLLGMGTKHLLSFAVFLFFFAIFVVSALVLILCCCATLLCRLHGAGHASIGP